MCRLQGHSAAERIKVMKNFNYPIRNGTGDLPACSAVPQLKEPLPTPIIRREKQHTLTEACSSVIWSTHMDCTRAEEGPSR